MTKKRLTRSQQISHGDIASYLFYLYNFVPFSFVSASFLLNLNKLYKLNTLIAYMDDTDYLVVSTNTYTPLEEWESARNHTDMSGLLHDWFNERVQPVRNKYEDGLMRILDQYHLTLEMQNYITYLTENIYYAYHHDEGISTARHVLATRARPVNVQDLDGVVQRIKDLGIYLLDSEENTTFVENRHNRTFFILGLNSWWVSYRHQLELLNEELDRLQDPTWRENHCKRESTLSRLFNYVANISK